MGSRCRGGIGGVLGKCEERRWRWWSVGDGEVEVGWINSQVCVCLVHVPSMGGDNGSSRWWCGYMDRIGWLLVLKVGSSCGFD